jgi:type 2 lantibiotic biosynthesis protein LanM
LPEEEAVIMGIPPLHTRRALTLAERRVMPPWSQAMEGQGAAEAAELARWWERTYFPERPSLFTRRLEADGLNRHSVLPLLAAGLAPEPDSTGSSGVPCPLSPLPCQLTSVPASGTEIETKDHFEPFLAWAWAQVADAIESLEASAPSSLSTDTALLEEQFREHLGRRLFDLSVRLFITRLQVARMEGRLVGATPEERFESWASAELAHGDALSRLLHEYPVLARSLAATAAGAASSWVEMLGRLASDWPMLRDAFQHGFDAPRVIGVDAGLGDTHRGGRTVMRIRMSSGFEVFYKPRPMGVDAHVQDLIRWLGARGLDPAPRTVVVVDRGEYGWMEPVRPAPCETLADVTAFYRRLGALLLVVYLLDGSDVHGENLIASGGHPVMVDLETMFQARPRVDAGSGPPPAMRVQDITSNLVLGTLLLPARGVGMLAGVEGGGLADLAGQRVSRVADVCDVNTDRMRVAYREVVLAGHDNVPRLDGDAVRASDHVEDIVAGFIEAHRVVVARREELLAEDGPVQAFRQDRVRHILRATDHYAVLLRGSYHPSCLRDAAHRGFVFDALWLGALIEPHLERVIASEQEDLMTGDVPYFCASVDSRDLIDSRGRVILGFLATSGLSRVIARVEATDKDDLLRQVTCIRGAFAASSLASTSMAPTSAPAVRPPGLGPCREATPPELVEAAEEIGDRLSRLAIIDNGEAHWTGLLRSPAGGYEYSVVGPDLYEGGAGIALFLAYLARATDRPDFERLARAAYVGAARQFASPAPPPSVGAFSGLPGLLYTALHLSDLFGDPRIVGDALRHLDPISREVGRGSEIDVMHGSAGCLLVMLRLAEHVPSSRAMEVAGRCGSHLLQHVAWTDGGRPLLGLSHGAAGVAAALAQLARASADLRFDHAARRALAYERARFDPGSENWPDLRGDDDDEARPPTFMWAWCHGAPGIGIARLMTPVSDDATRHTDVAIALSSTEGHGFDGPDNLCHGGLGNTDLFLLAAREYGDPRWRSRAMSRAFTALDRRRQTGAWRCDAPDGLEPPSLMTGVAGIGYQLLRLADPDTVPSVLALEGPRRGGG